MERSWYFDTDAHALKVREWGFGVRRCVCLHGLADGGFVWRDLARLLGAEMRVTALDLRGHGDSRAKSGGSYGFEDYLADVRSFLANYGGDRFVLVGHSLGGDIAARLAGERVSGLAGVVIVDTGPSEHEAIAEVTYELLKEAAKPFSSLDAYVAWHVRQRPLADREALSELAVFATKAGLDGQVVAKYDTAVLGILKNPPDDSWWRDSLQAISCPVLLVRGVASAVISKASVNRMAEWCSRPTVVTIPSAGHAVMSDNPLGFRDAVAPFVRACFDQRAPRAL